jgi:cobalt-zinc-cadmium efflux system outer membrane protein
MTTGMRKGGASLPGLALIVGIGLVPASSAEAQGSRGSGVPEAISAGLPAQTEFTARPDPLLHGTELTLQELYRLAAQRNPRIAAARAYSEAAGAMEASATLPPDPVVEIGVMNFSIPGFSADMPTSMAPSIRAMQMLPFPGKLALTGRIAERTKAIRETQAEEVWWEVRGRVAMAFYEIYSVDRELAVMSETLGLLEDFERVARSMYAAGTGRQADVLRAGVEIARMDAEIERMQAMGKVARASLNALLDRPGDTPVPEAVFPPLPGELPPMDSLRAWADASRPLLAGGRLEVDQSGTRRDLARRELWPDFSVGVEYGRRSTADMGVERMGSVMLGFSVPVFARSRQFRMRDEAAAMERMARADLTEKHAWVEGRIAGLVAELDRTRTLIRLFRIEVLPQARTNVESAFTSYRSGVVDFMTLVDAQMSLNRYEGELYRLLAEYGTGLADLETTLGREIPLGTHPILEER